VGHDLAVVDMVCDEVLVLYQGRIVEQGTPQRLFSQAAHPYTRALLEAVPRLRAAPARPRVTPDTTAPVSGGSCAFAPRCAHREARCGTERPLLRPIGAAHAAACHRADWVAAQPVDAMAQNV
jgi:peptide/nickel transport system ATP-binding protein